MTSAMKHASWGTTVVLFFFIYNWATAQPDAVPYRSQFVTDKHLKVYVQPLPDRYSHNILVRREKYKVPEMGEVIGGDYHLRATDQFAIDVWFYFQWLQSPLRVHSVEEADIVFVNGVVGRADPFYEQDEHRYFVEFLSNAETLLPDVHMKPHVFGYARVAWDNHRLIRNHTELTWTVIELLTGHRGATNNMIVVPYPAHAHYSRGSLEYYAKFDEDATSAKKVHLVSETFITRLPFRQALRKHCDARSSDCRHYEWDNNQQAFLESQALASESWYCLQPPGDSPTRRSFWDCIFVNTIPVVFSTDYFQTLPFKDLIKWDELIVYIPKEDVEQNKYNIVDRIKAQHTTESALKRLAAIHRVRHILQYSMNPVHELIRYDEVNVMHPEDDAFTTTWKTIVRHLCRTNQLPNERCDMLTPLPSVTDNK